MTLITNEDMRKRMAQTKAYCAVILKAGPNRHIPGVEKIIREHGRRNFALREEGVLSIVCPVTDGGEVSGIGSSMPGLTGSGRLWMKTREYGKVCSSTRSIRAGVFPGIVCRSDSYRYWKEQ
jgi:hypothetical protein